MTRAAAVAAVLAGCALALPARTQSTSSIAAPDPGVTGVASPAPASDPRDRPLLAACGPGDRRLNAVAADVAERASRGLGAPNAVELGELLRARGEPHAKARAWTLTASAIDRAEASERLQAWLATLRSHGSRRCGVASRPGGARGASVAVVAVDAMADLRQDIPMHVRPGAWVMVDAVARVEATAAKVVVLGPRGVPRTIPTSFDAGTGRILARFRADVAGAWLLQVLASIDVGPLPVLEARLNAGEAPPRGDDELQAPGETEAAGLTDEADALRAMIDAARATERLGPLERDTDLERVAASHVARMMAAGVIGHDVGDGTPPSRLQDAGIAARETGENVAKAPTAALAHRALWWSPSHRGNLLHGRYTRVGVAARRDARGALWVTEVFAD